MDRHFHLLVEHKGERFACLTFRKVANWYCRVLRPGPRHPAAAHADRQRRRFRAHRRGDRHDPRRTAARMSWPHAELPSGCRAGRWNTGEAAVRRASRACPVLRKDGWPRSPSAGRVPATERIPRRCSRRKADAQAAARLHHRPRAAATTPTPSTCSADCPPTPWPSSDLAALRPARQKAYGNVDAGGVRRLVLAVRRGDPPRPAARRQLRPRPRRRLEPRQRHALAVPVRADPAADRSSFTWPRSSTGTTPASCRRRPSGSRSGARASRTRSTRCGGCRRPRRRRPTTAACCGPTAGRCTGCCATATRRPRRPSQHDIGPHFRRDNGGAIPPNLLQIPNTRSSDDYFRRCRDGRAADPPGPLSRAGAGVLHPLPDRAGPAGPRPVRRQQRHRPGRRAARAAAGSASRSTPTTWPARGCASRTAGHAPRRPVPQQGEVPGEALLQVVVEVAQQADVVGGDAAAVAQRRRCRGRAAARSRPGWRAAGRAGRRGPRRAGSR